jgi:hypothetical protein
MAPVILVFMVAQIGLVVNTKHRLWPIILMVSHLVHLRLVSFLRYLYLLPRIPLTLTLIRVELAQFIPSSLSQALNSTRDLGVDMKKLNECTNAAGMAAKRPMAL